MGKSMNAMNKNFRTAENVVFTKVNEKDVQPTGNFITVRNGKAVALMDGKEVPMPEVLYNEIGVDYHFISSFYEHAKKNGKKTRCVCGSQTGACAYMEEC
jgi:hypothetical protein